MPEKFGVKTSIIHANDNLTGASKTYIWIRGVNEKLKEAKK